MARASSQAEKRRVPVKQRFRPAELAAWPDEKAFVPEPPHYSASDMARLCAALLSYWNKLRFVDGVDTPGPSPEVFMTL